MCQLSHHRRYKYCYVGWTLLESIDDTLRRWDGGRHWGNDNVAERDSTNHKLSKQGALAAWLVLCVKTACIGCTRTWNGGNVTITRLPLTRLPSTEAVPLGTSRLFEFKTRLHVCWVQMIGLGIPVVPEVCLANPGQPRKQD